jgi:murein DD-endopeptidase MepM/ murein hydrolase activator NlpD
MIINSRFLATILTPAVILLAPIAIAQSLEGAHYTDPPAATSSSKLTSGNGATESTADAGIARKTIVKAHRTAPKGSSSAAFAPPVTYVSGYGNYCSKTWPATGGSAFGYVSNGGDPCQFIDPNNTGVLQRKGLYSSSGWNNVILRCDIGPSQQGLWFWTGIGNDPLGWAFQTAYGSPGKSNCVFTVAPRELPVFHEPFDNLTLAALNGFDFARPPYKTLDVTIFGQQGSTTAAKVDYRGRDMSGLNFIDDHTGHDWIMPKGTKLKAVADGVVVRAETYLKSVDNKVERHVYIRHKVCGVNDYCEEFMSYYTHMDSISVSDGQTVTRGQIIGESGDSGTTLAHLHYTAARLTNTSNDLKRELVFTDKGTNSLGQRIDVGSDIYNWSIDPFGWVPLNGPDPWSLRGYPSGIGAMSIKLWVPGHTPTPVP